MGFWLNGKMNQYKVAFVKMDKWSGSLRCRGLGGFDFRELK
jgi:hypothetical protein